MKEYLQMQDTLGTIGFNQLVSYSTCIELLFSLKNQHFEADTLHTIDPHYDFAHNWLR